MFEPRFLALCRPVIFLCRSRIKKSSCQAEQSVREQTCSGHKSLLLLSALSIHSFVEGSVRISQALQGVPVIWCLFCHIIVALALET